MPRSTKMRAMNTIAVVLAATFLWLRPSSGARSSQHTYPDLRS